MELAFKMYHFILSYWEKRYWAVYMSSTVVNCSTPFFSTTVSKEVLVKVSNNGQEWSHSQP